ncbi:MAG: M3 family metallopeptidase [Salibacteraceae bacterium]
MSLPVTKVTEQELIKFNSLDISTFIKKLEEGIENAKRELEDVLAQSDVPNFENTIEKLEFIGTDVNELSSIFFNLNSAETTEQIQGMAPEFSAKLTAYGNDVAMNAELFERVKQVWGTKQDQRLTAEQTTVLEKTYLGFVRNGALLNEKQKNELRAIDEKLSSTSLKFGENVLAETNSYKLVLEETDLEGLPTSVVEYAMQTAKESGDEGKWVINLQYPSFLPFMKYSSRRDLRETLYLASATKACKGDEFDNQEIVKEIAHLRLKRANLLGYDSHADYVLERRMAKSPKVVTDFMDDMLEKAKPAAEADVARVAELAKEDGIDKLQGWDFSYYAEKLKQKELNLDEEKIKPYFELNNVINGVFNVARILFGYDFELRDDIEVYHNDVLTYEVKDRDGNHKAYFYADFFPRKGKRQGAWMTSFKGQHKKDGKNYRPHISIVCNFSKPTALKPALLTFNEVTTLFHEFGHALHGMSSECTYPSVSGTSVFWDFVELPSQILENWCYEKEALEFFARHYNSKELIPDEEIEKIVKSQQFLEGYNTMRQLSFGYLDMGWHARKDEVTDSVFEFEKSVLNKTALLPRVEEASTSCQFAHIFKGGYSSGYYSYKWAEVLDADAFELFKKEGIFNKEVAQSFYDHVLSAGGSEHPAVLYERFRGRQPKVDALLYRAGLDK